MNLLYKRETLVFYEFKGTRPAIEDIIRKMPDGMSLEHHKCAANLSPAIYRALFPYGYSLLLQRMKRHEAQVVTLTLDDELIAYGWLQTWKPFRRLYRTVSTNGTMIGPAWTSPDWRGRGIHSIMLNMRLCQAPHGRPIFSFADEHNHASRKGLIRTGFTEIATVELLRIACLLRYCQKVHKT